MQIQSATKIKQIKSYAVVEAVVVVEELEEERHHIRVQKNHHSWQ